MAKLKEEVREKITFWCHEKCEIPENRSGLAEAGGARQAVGVCG